jgi:hypothetical protein
MVKFQEIRNNVHATIDWLAQYNREDLVTTLAIKVLTGVKILNNRPLIEGTCELNTGAGGIVIYALVLRSDHVNEISCMMLRHTLVHTEQEIHEAKNSMQAMFRAIAEFNCAPAAIITNEIRDSMSSKN